MGNGQEFTKRRVDQIKRNLPAGTSPCATHCWFSILATYRPDIPKGASFTFSLSLSLFPHEKGTSRKKKGINAKALFLLDHTFFFI